MKDYLTSLNTQTPIENYEHLGYTLSSLTKIL